MSFMKAPYHRLTGLCAGLIAWSVLPHHTALSLLAIPAGLIGGNAPDRLEWLGNRRWLPHRTLTHWLPVWLFALAAGCLHLSAPWGAALCGYAAGGLAHLLFDLPNPTGVPVLLPHRRCSLHWWNSGEHDPELAAVAIAAAILALWMRTR